MDSSDDDAVAAAEMLGLFLKSKLDARKKKKRMAIVIRSIRNIVQTCVLLIKSYQLNNFITVSYTHLTLPTILRV